MNNLPCQELWNLLDDIIDTYYITRKPVRTLTHQVQLTIKTHKYNSTDIKNWLQYYNLAGLVQEIELAKNGVSPYTESYDCYSHKQLEIFYEMILEVHTALLEITGPSKQKFAKSIQKPVQSGKAIIIYDYKSELIKYLEGDELEIQSNKVVGFNKDKSWIKIAKGKNFDFPIDSWESTFEFIHQYQAKHWPATGKLGDSAKILAVKV